MTKLWTGQESVKDGRTDGWSLFLYPTFFFEKGGGQKLCINVIIFAGLQSTMVFQCSAWIDWGSAWVSWELP
jgi:hypothetical protein